jgi:hypothetical protein
MKLPNGELAIVEIAKLRDYCLDPLHDEGKHKARMFAAALGLESDDAEWLREQLLMAARTQECALGKTTPFGQRYIMDFVLTLRARSARLRCVWNLRPNETQPRLITCYVL